MSGKLCPDLLVKEELLYEVRSYGLVVENRTTVAELRKKYRATCSLGVTRNLTSLSRSVSFPAEVTMADTVLGDINDIITEIWEDKSVTELARVKNRMAHWGGRIGLLKTIFHLNVKETEVVDQLLAKHAQIAQRLSGIGEDNIIEVDKVIDKVNASMSLVEEDEAVPEAQTQSPYVSPRPATQSFDITSLYNKMTNPIEKYFKNMRVCNGLNIHELLYFLKTMITVRKETSLPEDVIMELCIGYTQGPLHDCLLQSKLSGNSVAALHGSILSKFVPLGLKEKLKGEHIFRPQRHGEALHKYIGEVKEYNLLLKTGLSEKDVCDIVKTGLNQETRGRLIFCNNPQTYQDLDELCVYLQNVVFEDRERDCKFSEQGGVNRAVNYPSRPVANRPLGERPRLPNNAPRQALKCFKCEKVGHIARNCTWNSRPGASGQSKVDERAKNV